MCKFNWQILSSISIFEWETLIETQDEEVIFMEQLYWEHFKSTGRVEDYLYYRGMKLCEKVMERNLRKAAGEKDLESDCSNRHGIVGDTYR